MPCTKGRISPSSNTKLRLFADSGGYCQNPGCSSELFRDIENTAVHLAEMAHIISATDKGPRAISGLTPVERGGYSNLVLLCPTCHTMIDKAPEKFPEPLLKGWKHNHKERIANLFGVSKFSSRPDARDFVEPLLTENRTIFQNYGPLTKERHNPESSLPVQWIRKIRVKIIPNNRILLAACDANYALLSDAEIKTVELFRQHVDDFEAKHLGEANQSGSQFPKAMEQLFVD